MRGVSVERGAAVEPKVRVDVPMADGARVAAFVYAPQGVADAPGTPFAVGYAPAPVVVLHGNGETHEHMAAVVEALAEERSVIALDSRGHGASWRGSEPLTYELMAADVLEVMSRLGVTQAHVLGFSDGGIAGLIVAREAPARVLSLTTLGANLTPEGLASEAREGMRAALAELEQRRGEARAACEDGAAARCVSEYDASGAEPIMCEAAGEPARYAEEELLRLMLEQPQLEASSLAKVCCPACVMAGEHDLITPEETARIAETLPAARLVVVPECGHDLPLESPQAVVEAAREAMTAGEGVRHLRPLVTFEAGVPQVREAPKGIAVVRATPAMEPAVLALYERVLDACEEPGRETCGWKRGFWPLPNDVSARLRAGTTWVAAAAADVTPAGELRYGARVLGAMSLDHDFGLDGVEPAWEPLAPAEALTCHLLATDPEARGRGVATALLCAYAREGLRRGCGALRINTSPQSLSNRLYHELGFVQYHALWFPYEGLPLTPWTNVYELRLDGRA